MPSTKSCVSFLAILTLSIVPFTAVGCASDIEEGDDAEHEDDPGTSADAIISAVDCTKTRQTAYDQGRPSPIDVIKIGNKPTSLATGHAFLKMQKAAHAAGVSLTINSGFRTMAEQQYFYNCYQTGRCNNGNLAARPGYSNHQNGRALDLTTSSWLANNASRFGFKRTVPSEAWHYEFFGADPGGPCSAGGPGSSSGDPGSSGGTSSGGTTSGGTSGGPTGGQSCNNDGDCNPGSDGAGMICTANKCVPGCHSNAQCPGVKSCQAGQCR
jgi:hypothetical protein